MASLSENHYNLYQLILWSHFKKITTLDELASVLCVPVEDLYQYLPGVYKKDTGDRAITGQELEYISGKLAENPAFQAYHLRTLEERRRLAQQYLIQELDLSDDQFAFVDVSGGGLTQGCLRQLIKDRYRKPIRTFFFKIDRVNLVEKSITDTFIPSYLNSNLVVEMMCRAPHGQTDGYIEKEGKTVPVTERHEGALQIEHGFYEYEEGIADFTGLMCEVSQQYGVGTVPVKIILRYLEYIAKEPSKEVLEFFASTPSCEAGRGSESAEYAPRLTPQQIREIYLVRTSEPVELFYKGTDLNYSILRASEEERMLIDRYRKEHDSTLGKLARLEKEQMQKEQRRRYGRAAFYPTRLLEERIILYGAGKFGQDLHNRLLIEQRHHIVLWVDKNAAACRERGLTDVQDISEIKTVFYDQLVIAVMDEKVADSIRKELEAEGVCKENILWMQSPADFYQMAQWRTEGIG